MNATDEYLAAHPDATERPSGQVTEHLERLYKTVSMVVDAALRLEARLDLVLLTEPENGDVRAEVAVVQNRVPLAESLANVEARLDRVVRQLEDVTRRCEL